MRYFKKIIAILLVLAVSLPYAWAFEVVASSATQRELLEIEAELRELEGYMDEGSALLQNLRRELQELRDEMFELDMQIARVMGSIIETEEAIVLLSHSIEVVGAERTEAAGALEVARANREEGQDVLAARVRAMHESGQINILDVLFNAESITDFLVRLEDLRTVIRFNRELIERLEEYEEEYQRSNEELFLLEGRLQDLQRSYEIQHEELEWHLENLYRQMEEKGNFIAELEGNEERFELLLELLELEHYELVERGLAVRARFDREMAAAAFNHTMRQAGVTSWRPTPSQPMVHTASAMPSPVVGAGGIVNRGLALIEREMRYMDYHMRESIMRREQYREADIPVSLWEQPGGPLERRVGSGDGRFEWPVPSRPYVAGGFGERHTAIDILADAGTPIVAAQGGVVIHSDWTLGLGNAVVIDHGNGYRTMYIHNQSNHVQVGQQVERGQHIADIGMTGGTRINHVHFEIWRDNVPVDPMQFFD